MRKQNKKRPGKERSDYTINKKSKPPAGEFHPCLETLVIVEATQHLPDFFFS